MNILAYVASTVGARLVSLFFCCLALAVEPPPHAALVIVNAGLSSPDDNGLSRLELDLYGQVQVMLTVVNGNVAYDRLR